MFKNVGSQKVAVFAWDAAAGAAKTGDAANITGQISIDGAATAATDDTNPTELDATDAPGVYLFDTTQAETNGDLIILQAASSTADIEFRPVIIYTQTVMRGTDSAALAATALTDATWTDAKAGYIDHAISTVDTVVDGLATELAKVPKSDAAVSWNATALGAINAECDTALTDYDPPTKSEMDTAHALLATEAKQDIIDTNVDQIVSDTNELQTDDIPGKLTTLESNIRGSDSDDLKDISDEVAAISDLSTTIDGTVTAEETLKALLAFIVGLTEGGGTTEIKFKRQDDSTDAIKMTVDADGNRSSVVLDL